MTQPDLRPLGIGEVLDRAVNLFVKRFAVLALVLAVVAIPVGIAQFATSPATGSLFADLQKVFAVPPGHDAERAELLRQFSARNRLGAATVGLLVLTIVLHGLSNLACAIAVGQAYGGRLPSVRDVYRDALRRWPAQIAVLVAFLGIYLVILIVLMVLVFLVALAIAALAAVSQIAALVIGIPIGVVAFVVLAGAILLWYFALQMAMVAVALEDANPVRAIASGVRRTLVRGALWRSLLVALVLAAVSGFGSIALVAIGGAVSAIAHVAALYPIVVTIGEIALDALFVSFVVIYSIDVRVRREGYDLVLAARAAP